MNGSANGSSSAYSSTRAMRMGSQIEEPQLAALPLELPARFALEHHRDQAVPRMKDQGMERPLDTGAEREARDRKSTRLNSSHLGISYAVFCLKKKKKLQPLVTLGKRRRIGF